MRIGHTCLIALTGASLIVLAGAAAAQTAGAPNPGPQAASSGGELVAVKCFQCHTDSMFRDQRQDRRAWTATIYRMVGRGGLWTQDEIDAMADYLAAAFGPDVKRASAQPQ
jgi:mono/diheme cytochrome c family protein